MILPRVPASFEWRDSGAGPALVCSPLDAIAPHLFTTQPWLLGAASGGGSGAWAEIAGAFDASPTSLVRLHQVHGSGIVRSGGPADDGGSGRPPDGDIVTGRIGTNCVLVVQAADCIPILLADARSGAVAAAHAGWRGLALGVPSVAVRALEREYGARPDDLIAAFGPSIGACCYEVGSDVRASFEAAGFTDEQLARWFVASRPRPRGHAPVPALARDQRPGHWYFDGWLSVREQLESAGIRASQLFGAELCTAGHPGLLCSYRRDGAAAGRMAAAITTELRPRRPAQSAG